MCTILALVSVRRDFPVVLATNRDEFFARPASGAARILRTPSTVGGRDLVGLGTWMGVTEAGFFVGVTNQRSLHPPDPRKRSRGEVVVQALKRGNSEDVRSYLESLDGPAYNAFNLMWGDARGLFTAYAREDAPRLALASVPAGVHVLPNDVLDSPDFFKVARAQTLLRDVADVPFDACVTQLKNALHDRVQMPLPAARDPRSALAPELLRALSALAVATPSYGTRSSTIVALREQSVGHYLYADGRPPDAPFVDVLPLFRAEPDAHSA